MPVPAFLYRSAGEKIIWRYAHTLYVMQSRVLPDWTCPLTCAGNFLRAMINKAVRRRLSHSWIQIFILIFILNVIFYILVIFGHLTPFSAGYIFYATWELAIAGNGIDIIGTF